MREGIPPRPPEPGLCRKTLGVLPLPSPGLQHSKGATLHMAVGRRRWYAVDELRRRGSIKQTIIPDNTNHRIWVVDSAKTFHLQVVNAAHFEELTGVIAPDTLITIEQYASSGFPFFDIYNETPNPIYGNFGGLKTKLDSTFQPQPSDRWSSRSRAVNKSQCNVSLLDCMYVPSECSQ